MKYIIETATIHELGMRTNQEDAVFPALGKTTAEDRLFILCDGMGGHDFGEVASQTVCDAMSKSVLDNNEPEGSFTDDDFRQSLSDAFDALDMKDTGGEKKMGTTMTFLKLHEAGATIAHIGDSRVYHIRPGKDASDTSILHQTVDHSLVNDLLKIGEITPEEARDFPQKNVITRAMQPGMERRPKADLCHTSDILSGDWFFLCSDGMLERMEDENIQFIFSEKVDGIANKREMLIEVTKENKDNHSAILVHILKVFGPDKYEDAGNGEKVQAVEEVADEIDGHHRKPSKTLFVSVIIAFLLLILVLAFWYYQKHPFMS